MLRIVLDTNVVVSGLLHQKGAPATILDAATSKQFRCHISESLLDEYREVLTRDYLGLNQHRQQGSLETFERLPYSLCLEKK